LQEEQHGPFLTEGDTFEDFEEKEISIRGDMSCPEKVALISYLRDLSEGIKDTGSSLSAPPAVIEDVFRSVLGDPWHYMDRIRVPVKHAYRKAFFVALSEAFFAWDPRYMEQAREALKIVEGKSDAEIDAMTYYNSKFFLRCVPRVVLPPTQLYWRVRNVYLAFGSRLHEGKPLFNSRAWKKADNVLKEILMGYASDPPGAQLYYRSLDKNGDEETNRLGLPVFTCLRGTGLTESAH